ncbi:MAG: molybdenum cofactor guanylyltransferase [Pirellulaceae bacterium]|nr:molybdenum cofactor guanylyltransferase [Pirellulaceae bacterium]
MDLPPPTFRVGGIVLCGGRSSRMGRPKLALPFGPELMLQRVVRLLAQVVSPIVVVAAPEQELPPLSGEVLIARDELEGRGPLQGLLAGLSAIAPLADAAYATSCDVPLLVPGFVRHMLSRLDENEIAVPVEGEFHHPLAAIYRPRVAGHIAELLAVKQLRPVYLYDRARTCRVPVDELRQVDPDLATLRNLNRPADYLAALAQAGFTADPGMIAALGAPHSE